MSELSQNVLRSTVPSVAPSNAASIPLPSSMRATQAANARNMQQNARTTGPASVRPAQPQPDIVMIYRTFTSAIIGSISYHSARSQQFVPLNSRTFVALHPLETNRASYNSGYGERSVWLITIDVHLATAGTLVITTTATQRPQTLSLRKLKSLWHAAPSRSCILRVAPNGVIARLVDEEMSPYLESTEEIERQQGKRSGRQLMQKAIQTWKSAVQLWLERRGIHLEDLSKEESWTSVCLSNQLRQDTISSPGHNFPARELLWPVALCFCYISENMMQTDKQSSSRATSEEPSCFDVVTSVDWFQLHDQHGFRDPYQFPEDWFLGKPERDKAIDAFRQSQRTEEEAAIMHVDTATALPASPVYSRGMYGDMQAASGVYPTPPDGVFFQGIGGTNPTDELNIASNNAEAQFERDAEDKQGDEGDVSDVERGPFNVPVDEAHEPSYVHQEPDTMDFDTPFDDGTDDLFEDMDEDIYTGTGNDITEADFSFFDEPGAPGPGSINTGVLLGDGHDKDRSEGLGGSLTLSIPIGAAGLPLQATDTHTPEGQLVHGQVDPSLPSRAELDDIFTQHQTVALTEMLGGQTSNSPTDANAEASEFDPITVTDSPLNPLKIRNKLLGSPTPAVLELEEVADEENVNVDQRRGSRFNPVAFDPNLDLLDAKYGAEGRFQFLSKSRRKRAHDTCDGHSTHHHSTATKHVCISLPSKMPKLSSRINNKYERRTVETAFSPEGLGHVSPREQSDTSDDDTASTVSSVSIADVRDDAHASSKRQYFRAPTTAKRKSEIDGNRLSPLQGSLETIDGDRHTEDEDIEHVPGVSYLDRNLSY